MTVVDSTVTAQPVRLLAAWHETGRADLEAHRAVHGPLPVARRHDREYPERLLDAVARSGLTGRGGAGFPTVRKLQAIARVRRRPLVVVNALEGEPASSKDAVLLTLTPHLVLDGAELVGEAIGAVEIAVCIPEHRDDLARHLGAALAERAAAGMGTAPVRVSRLVGRYVSGEESALADGLAGGEGRPHFRVSKGAPLAVRRRPALVHNAETLAHIALIARHGPGWFRSAGSPEAPGTSLVSVSGMVQRPGVYEVELGTPVGAIVDQAVPAEPIGAVLVGGYGGAWLSGKDVGTPYTPKALAAAGSTMGVGVLGVVGRSTCGVAETARVASYLAGESAGQCGPCTFGLPAIARDLLALAHGDGDQRTLARLQMRLDVVVGRGACRHPDGAVRLVRSALSVFADDLAHHVRHRPCSGWNRRPLLPVPVSR